MHDGAGAWLKSAVARACLAGVGIGGVKDFFTYCIQFLHENVSPGGLTTERHFYLLTVEALAAYRATMPAKVTGSLKIKPTKDDSDGWFFWATGAGENSVYQRRCPCACAACEADDFLRCEKQEEDTCSRGWWNEPQVQD